MKISALAESIRWFLVALTGCVALGALSACGEVPGGDASHRVNGSVHVLAGKPPTSVATVNGSIDIDDDAAVTSAETVNGPVHLGDRAHAESLQTVNGGITLGKSAHVAHDVRSVNGTLTLGEGSEVLGALENVNGHIEVESAHVARGIQTVNGGIDLTRGAHVEGGIHVRKPSSSLIQIGNDEPRVVIGAGVVVQGDLVFDRKVVLYVNDKAVIGPVTGATPIPFSGDTAPP